MQIDLCVTAQYPTFQEVEQQIEEALGELTHYYRSNSLRANPEKTQVTAFHLWNREAKMSLQVSWNGVDLENTDTPKYLGVTLDRTLSYKTHIQNTKMKVPTRNNLLKKLANSRWGTNARTIRTTTLALCYSTAEYCGTSMGKVGLCTPTESRIESGMSSHYWMSKAPPEIRRSVMFWAHTSKKTV